MAAYFDIIISLENFFSSIINSKIYEEVEFYAEYFNEKDKLHLKKVDPLKFKSSDFNKPTYRGFFMISKSVNFKIDKSPYNDDFFQYAIEIKGGKEDGENLEVTKFRRISKKPDKSINKVYEKLQKNFKQNENFGKGVNWGNHFYKNIYFDKSVNKRIWQNLNEKDSEIKINTNQ